MKRISFFIMAVLLMTTHFVWASAEPGAKAPDFKLKGHDGQEYVLSQVLKEGQPVVLEWFNNECPYVKKHYDSKNMQGLQKKYVAKNVKWFSIISSAEGKQGYQDAKGATAIRGERGQASTAVLLDPSGKVGKLYKAKTTPQMFVIKPDGVIAYNGAIDNRPTADKDDIPGATNYLVEALDAVLAGQKVKTAKTKPYGCSVKYASSGWF